MIYYDRTVIPMIYWINLIFLANGFCGLYGFLSTTDEHKYKITNGTNTTPVLGTPNSDLAVVIGDLGVNWWTVIYLATENTEKIRTRMARKKTEKEGKPDVPDLTDLPDPLGENLR